MSAALAADGVGMEARRAETPLGGSVHDSPTPFRGDAPKCRAAKVVEKAYVPVLDDAGDARRFSSDARKCVRNCSVVSITTTCGSGSGGATGTRGLWYGFWRWRGVGRRALS